MRWHRHLTYRLEGWIASLTLKEDRGHRDSTDNWTTEGAIADGSLVVGDVGRCVIHVVVCR